MPITLVDAQQPGVVDRVQQPVQRGIALRPLAHAGHQLAQLLAQAHQMGALGQLALHVLIAQAGEALDEGIGAGELQFRASEQVALHVAGAALQGKVQLSLGFHALGDDPAAGLLGHLRQGLDHFAAGTATGGGLEQAHVQLEDVRLQGQYPVQLRVAGAEVVDGDACPGLAVARHHVREFLAAAAQLGDLEHHALRRHTVFLQLLEAGQGLVGAQAADPAGRDVDTEEPVRRCLVQAQQGIVADLPVQPAQGRRRNARVGEQRAYRAQAAVGLAQAPERLDTGNAASGRIDKGLEAGDRLPLDHNVFLVRSGELQPVRHARWTAAAERSIKQECGQLNTGRVVRLAGGDCPALVRVCSPYRPVMAVRTSWLVRRLQWCGAYSRHGALLWGVRWVRTGPVVSY